MASHNRPEGVRNGGGMWDTRGTTTDEAARCVNTMWAASDPRIGRAPMNHAASTAPRHHQAVR